MKKSLYNIEAEYLEIANQLEDGELTPELETALAITEGELQTKAVGYGFIIREAEGNITTIDSEIKRLTALKKSEQSKVDRLKSSISNAMQLFGITEVKTPTLKLSFRASKRVVGSPLVDLPDELVTIVPEQRKPNLTAIKSTIENGFEVEGYSIEEFQNLQIK
jgi:hypothetical protein